MSDEVRVWKVDSTDSLQHVQRAVLSREERIENWIARDTSVLEPKLLVIGRQVKTDFNKEIDLLCITDTGDLVIVELKRGLTPREVTAQALDYASWVKDLIWSDPVNHCTDVGVFMFFKDRASGSLGRLSDD